MSSTKKIGIFGIGAIGSAIAFAVEDMHNLFYYNRSIRSNISIHFNNELCSKDIHLSNNSEQLIEFDFLFICIKEYHNNGALPFIKKLISLQTQLVIIRNGLHLKEPFLKIANEEQLIECVIDCPTEELSKGQYLQHRKGIIFTEKGKIGNELSNLFKHDRIELKELIDFHTYKWKKLIESSAIGAIQVLNGGPCKIFKDKKNIELYKSVLSEGIKVARSDGANIDDQFYEDQISKLLSYPENKGSSMLSDSLNGRPIEWKAKNGIISKMGKQNQINTELNDFLCSKLKQINIE